MRFIERKVFELLIEAAALDGFTLRRIACTPATGEGEDVDALNAPGDGTPLTVAQAIAHANRWDANSVVEFKHEDGREFWVLLVWGNGEDVISDYESTAESNSIVERVYAKLESL